MKKISPNLIGFLIALLICVISLWVYFSYIEKESYHVIDNPTDKNLKVTIDEQNYMLAPMQQIEINLTPGNHTVSAIAENDTTSFPGRNFEVKNARGLINPTLSRYYIYGLPYGPKVNKDSIFRNLKTTFQGKTYMGDLRIDSAVYTEDFYYNLNEEFPSLTLKSENETLRRKIFREIEFKQFYFRHYE